MGLEDHKLRVFCTVAETSSFSKTSEIIHLTQPAVSLQIQALEAVYETKLFDRSSSSVTLTPSGEILYRYAKDILTMYAKIDKDIGEITCLVKGGISIGASTTIGNYLLPTVIAEFKKKNPKIKMQLLVGNTKRVVELLNAGNIDMGLVEGETTRYKIITEKFLTDELVLIVTPKHPWAKHKDVSMSELEREPLIFREEGSGTRQVIENYLGKRNISTQNMLVTAVLGSTEAIKDAVESGIGVAVVSKWAVRRENRYGSVKTVKFKEGRLLRDFSLVFNRNIITSYVAEEFISFVRNYPYSKLLA